MYLSDLEVIGFKSFAQKTKFRFSDGLAAIVGPNGCGKSNVVDAVRWVLGEKKASVLRSEIMENVIFNGTKDRKPTNLAEVTITLNNNKKVLPSEYTEINVTRRLYRSGESEYLLNKTKCRLKDIQDMFMDTGMGPDSYSVIELKMVEAILSGKVEERRAMFEEAAGIKKFKARRKDTLRKLEKVTVDLERIDDIVEEVRKNVASLSRQAAKTRRYYNLMESLKTNEVKLYSFQYNDLKSKRDVLSEEINLMNKKKISLEFKSSELEKNTELYKEELNSIERDLNAAKRIESELNKKYAELTKELAVAKEKNLSYGSNKSNLENEIQDSAEALKKQQALLEDSIKLLNDKSEFKSKLNEDFQTAKESLSEAKEKYNEQKTNEEIYKSQSMELKNKLNSIELSRKKSREKVAFLENKMQQNSEKIHSITLEIEQISLDIETKKSEFEEISLNIEELSTHLKSETERKVSIETELRGRRDLLSESKNKLNSLNSSLDFLNSISDLSDSSNFLLKSNKWNKKIKVLSEELAVDDEYKSALKTALREFSNALIVESIVDAEEGIEILVESKKGKVVFLDYNTQTATASYEAENDNLLINKIRCDEKLKTIVSGIIGNITVVDNLAAAKDIISEGKAGNCVTKDGILIDKYGFIKGGSVGKKEAETIGKSEKINKLNIEINNSKNEISEIESEISELNEELRNLDLQSIANDLKSAEQSKNDTQRKISSFDIKKESLNSTLESIENDIDRYNEEVTEIETADSKLDAEFDELNEKLLLLNEEFESFRKEFNADAEQLREAEQMHRNIELDLVRLNSEIDSIKNEQNRLSNAISSIKYRIENKKKSSSQIEQEHIKLEENIKVLESTLEETQIELNKIKTDVDVLAEQKSAKSENYESVNDELKQLRKEYDKIVERLHLQDIKLTEWDVNLKNIKNRLYDTHEIDIETIEYEHDEIFVPEDAELEISSVRSKLHNLGNVNFEALEQYEEQNERLQFYERQMEDLKNSQQTLADTIEEINDAAIRNFKETFTKIRENFRNLFQTLFGPEGEADITLAPGDMLEADIEIKAKPPNKRPHSIEMLSGGEKTLTAIALLFAIYLVKPSPFCILDEVDAPLDDSNIDKFINLIRKFSNETQFLIVTHNKKSMEAADTLYGITQQEPGISKVVSVRLNRNSESKNVE